ncbi:MAG: hypothetical protein ACRCXD_07015 [Luteolibacter sp.]
MNSIFRSKLATWVQIVSTTCFLLAYPAHAIIDSNSNGMSDLWEETYNQLELFPSTFDPQADPDHDGWTNAQEAAAGTDPHNSNAPSGFIRPEITHSPAIWLDSNGDGIDEIDTPEAHVVTWPTLVGKQYTLLFSIDLAAGGWIPLGRPRIGEGNPIGTGIPLAANSPRMFWRVKIEDIDSDNDDITDHEESQLGTDPYLADRDRDGIPDYWEFANSLDANDDGSNNVGFGAYGDPDGDGANNLEEFLEETDPNDAAAIPVRIHSISRISRQQTNDNPDSVDDGRWISSWALWDSSIPINTQSLSNTFYQPAAVGPDLASKIHYPLLQPVTAVKYPLPARFVILENGFYGRYSSTKDEDEITIITHSSLTQSRLWMEIPTQKISSASQKIPYLFVTLRTVYGYRDNGYGLPEIFQLPGTPPHPTTVYSHETVKFEFDPNSATSKLLDANSQLSGGSVGIATVSQPRLIRPDITWKAIGDYGNVSDHIDPWTEKKNGKRIFPDFKNPDDDQIRHKLEVIVKTSPELVGQPVFVRAFDVDDSTAEDFDREEDDGDPITTENAIIDSAGKGGNDNLPDSLDTSKDGHFWTGFGWGGNSAQGIVDANGETKFIFRVGMQPGNNYRIVASVIDEAMFEGVQTTNPAAAKYLGAELSQNGEAPASPLLTVWRRLWVENDSMEAIGVYNNGGLKNDLTSDMETPAIQQVFATAGLTTFYIPSISDRTSFTTPENSLVRFLETGNSFSSFQTIPNISVNVDAIQVEGNQGHIQAGAVFRMYDDDGFGLTGPALPRNDLVMNDVIKRAYHPAFIEVKDATQWNATKTVNFFRNHPPAVGTFLTGFNYGILDDALDAKLEGNEKLWCASIMVAYQPGSSDNDPKDETNVNSGATVGDTLGFAGKARVSIVYSEVVRDLIDDSLRNNSITASEYEQRLRLTAAHEIGHQPLYGIGEEIQHAEGGLMQDGGHTDMAAPDTPFTPKSIKRFRSVHQWRQKAQ